MMKTTPLAQVKERFGEKAKLVAAVQKLATADLWIDKVNADRGLDSVSNSKLLRLHDMLESVKKEFGSRDKLIGKLLELEKRTKDDGYKARLQAYSTPRLVDTYGAAAKRAKRASAKAPEKKAGKVARSKKAKAKAAA